MTELPHRLTEDPAWAWLALALTFTAGLALAILAYTARSTR